VSGPSRLLPPDDALLDASEAAQVLKVSRSTVLRWAAARDIAFSRVGRRTMFLGADVRAFVLSKRTKRSTLGQRAGEVLRRC
jgi:excisionase family DNA binding protein